MNEIIKIKLNIWNIYLLIITIFFCILNEKCGANICKCVQVKSGQNKSVNSVIKFSDEPEIGINV